MWALKRDFPELEFSLNGVVQDCHEAAAALQHKEAGARLHGVMIGRAAYHGPWASLGNADRAVFGAAANAAANRREVRSSLHIAWKGRATSFTLASMSPQCLKSIAVLLPVHQEWSECCREGEHEMILFHPKRHRTGA